MKRYSLTDLSNRSGEVADAALRAPVELTKRGRPRFVLMSIEDYERRMASGNPQRAYGPGEMPSDLAAVFADELGRAARGEGYDDSVETSSTDR